MESTYDAHQDNCSCEKAYCSSLGSFWRSAETQWILGGLRFKRHLPLTCNLLETGQFQTHLCFLCFDMIEMSCSASKLPADMSSKEGSEGTSAPSSSVKRKKRKKAASSRRAGGNCMPQLVGLHSILWALSAPRFRSASQRASEFADVVEP